MAQAGAAIYRSVDAGTTWTRLTAQGSYQGSSTTALSRSCGGGGLLTTTAFSPDFGTTWQPLPFQEVEQVTAGPGCVLYAARNMTSDAFVAKLSPDGSDILWATFLGGMEDDSATALAVDEVGNVYAGGATSSSDFPGSTLANGAPGAFLVKLSGSGQVAYSRVFNAGSVSGIALDTQGNTWLAGRAVPGFPLTAGAIDSQYGSGDDGYLAKLGPAGDWEYGTFTATGRSALAIAVDRGGHPIVAGPGTVFGQPVPPVVNTTSGFVVKLDADGSRILKSLNISGHSDSPGEGPRSLWVDSSGDIFVLGNTMAADFVTSPGAYVSPVRSVPCYTGRLTGSLKTGDIFVLKLGGADLTPIYSALVAGPCGSQPGSLYADSTGAATFSFSTGTSFPLVNPLVRTTSCPLPYELTPAGGNGVVARLSPDGSKLLFSSYTGACGVSPIPPGASSSVFAGLNFPYTVDPRARIEEFSIREATRISPRR